MDFILASLNDWRQGTVFSPSFSLALIGASFVLVRLAVSAADVLADIRAALRHAGISDKAAAIDFGVSKGNCSEKLSGDRPLTVQSLAGLPIEFWQWLAVALATRHGVPAPVLSGARLARRQARMSLSTDAPQEQSA